SLAGYSIASTLPLRGGITTMMLIESRLTPRSSCSNSAGEPSFGRIAAELVQIQSDFVSRQAQVLGERTKELGQRMMEGVQEIEKATEAGTAEFSKTIRGCTAFAPRTDFADGAAAAGAA